MKNLILILVLLSQALNANAFFAKPRAKLNHDISDENMIMALDSGKKVTVEFHNVTVCDKKKCKTVLEIGDSLKDTIKVIGRDLVDELDKKDKQAHHTIEVKYNADAVSGYVTLKDADTGKALHKIKTIVRSDDECYEPTNKVNGKITFPDGEVYILSFDNKCELEKAGATPYENN